MFGTECWRCRYKVRLCSGIMNQTALQTSSYNHSTISLGSSWRISVHTSPHSLTPVQTSSASMKSFICLVLAAVAVASPAARRPGSSKVAQAEVNPADSEITPANGWVQPETVPDQVAPNGQGVAPNGQRVAPNGQGVAPNGQGVAPTSQEVPPIPLSADWKVPQRYEIRNGQVVPIGQGVAPVQPVYPMLLPNPNEKVVVPGRQLRNVPLPQQPGVSPTSSPPQGTEAQPAPGTQAVPQDSQVQPLPETQPAPPAGKSNGKSGLRANVQKSVVPAARKVLQTRSLAGQSPLASVQLNDDTTAVNDVSPVIGPPDQPAFTPSSKFYSDM